MKSYQRVTLVGREGGKPPILLAFYRRKDGLPAGFYFRRSLREPPRVCGPMFEKLP